QPANLYAARAEDLKANHLRLVRAIQSALGIEVPAKLLAVLKSRPDAGQPPPLFAEMVPAPMQPHLRGFPPLFPRVPFGPDGFDPAADARARAQEMHERAQQRMREMQERARALRPRFGP